MPGIAFNISRGGSKILLCRAQMAGIMIGDGHANRVLGHELFLLHQLCQHYHCVFDLEVACAQLRDKHFYGVEASGAGGDDGLNADGIECT